MPYRRFFHCTAVILGVLLGAIPLAASVPDNSTIQGSYYFRYLGVDTSSTVDKAISAFGTITFDGNVSGKYTVSGTQINSNGAGGDTTTTVSTPGTYTVLSNGLFYISGIFTGNDVYGGVGKGPLLVGSSTESGSYMDLFVAVPVSNSNASNGTLNGTYYAASLEFQGGSFNLTRNTLFQILANGSGSLGSPLIMGYAANLGTGSQAQTSSNATYSVGAAGNGTMTFPAPSGSAAASVLLSGSKNLYVSPDGNFFVAGGASSYDIIVGVKALTGTANTKPLDGYYFTGVLADDLTPNGAGIYASQGAANETNGTELAYERENQPQFGAYDYTYSLPFTFSGNGTVAYTYEEYAAGAGGDIVVGSGMAGYYFLRVYVKSPTLSGPGVFLHPQGIVNTASFAPFEAQIAPGEFITLFGTGLATQAAKAQSLPLPTTLGNVQVTIDGRAIPLYQVSPLGAGTLDVIAGIVPFESRTDGGLVNIQVSNNGTPSNVVQLYSGLTSPGVFTAAQSGLGDGAILHGAPNPDGTANIVTASNPAKPGETVSLFLSGLGATNPAVASGAAAPGAEPFARLVDSVDVYIDGILASKTGDYQGLAPNYAGLYQINVTIPSNVTTGTSVDLELDTVDATNWQATIPIGK